MLVSLHPYLKTILFAIISLMRDGEFGKKVINPSRTFHRDFNEEGVYFARPIFLLAKPTIWYFPRQKNHRLPLTSDQSLKINFLSDHAQIYALI